jgi:hypothetical protein
LVGLLVSFAAVPSTGRNALIAEALVKVSLLVPPV